MELDKIKELMDAMQEKNMRKLRIKDNEFELELEKPGEMPAGTVTYVETPVSNTQVKSSAKHDIPPAHNSPIHAEDTEDSGTFITSPMVGTYYAAPSPDDSDFVKVGDRVEKDSVVCIIEAMKVMNEVKAGVAGTVSEILVDNSHPVEFGTKLFKIS